MLKNKTVLITGGAGSLGRAITGRLFKDFAELKKVIIYNRDELKHHYMSWEFSADEFPIEYVIGDVRDLERLTQVCEEVDIIIHAAALKQISTCENNPEECYKTNVFGTQNVIKAAKSSNVSKLLFVSTDKAVDPTSVYGNSKQAGEHLISNADGGQLTCATTRLGNLLGSAGSVIPFFLERSKTGELPITHPEMTRFGGTLDQGVDVCLYALEKMRGGEVFIPRWKSFRVGDLADAIAPECRKKIIGARKHEKMHERFFAKVELSRMLENKKYFIVSKEGVGDNLGLELYKALPIQINDLLDSESNTFWTIEELRLFIKSEINELQEGF